MSRIDDPAQRLTSRPRPPAWRRWVRLSTVEQSTSVEAFITIAAVRALVSALPAATIAKKIQGLIHDDPTHPARFDDSTTLEVIRRVRDSITRASHRVTKATCLIQAISGWFMLHRRGIRSTIRIGVQKDEGVFAAHAWLTIGDRIIIGGDDADVRFVTLESR